MESFRDMMGGYDMDDFQPRKMTIKPIFAWYDLWVGAFWDRAKRKLYILPLPCVGVVIEFNQRT